MLGPPKDASQEGAAHREAAGNGDLGAVQHHGVRKPPAPQRRADPTDRQRRIQHDERGPVGASEGFDGVDESWRWKQDLLLRADDRHGRSCIEAFGVGVGRGEDDSFAHWEPPPQLPEVRLDPSDLGREVVGDEQMRHVGEGL